MWENMITATETDMDHFKITLNGQGGELDCRTVETEDEIAAAVQDIALNCVLAPDDTIVISEIE